MISNKNKKNVLLIFIFFISITTNIWGQESIIKQRGNVKLGYSRHDVVYGEKTSNFRVEGNYGILNFIEAGVYFGFSPKVTFYYANVTDSSFSFEDVFLPSYGLNVNLHLLPLFIKASDFRFDLYITAKYGGTYFSTAENYYLHGNESEYGIGAGISFYLFDHLGVFAEYSYGKYFFDMNQSFRYGICMKF